MMEGVSSTPDGPVSGVHQDGDEKVLIIGAGKPQPIAPAVSLPLLRLSVLGSTGLALAHGLKKVSNPILPVLHSSFDT